MRTDTSERTANDVDDLVVAGVLLHRHFDGEAHVVARERRHCGDAPVFPIDRGGIPIFQRSADLHVVSALGVTDVGEDEVIVLAPA